MLFSLQAPCGTVRIRMEASELESRVGTKILSIEQRGEKGRKLHIFCYRSHVGFKGPFCQAEATSGFEKKQGDHLIPRRVAREVANCGRMDRPTDRPTDRHSGL
jgi:hypothetical protein